MINSSSNNSNTVPFANPFKLIHKYKNNLKMIQYNVMVFIGSSIPPECMNALDKIADESLFSSLVNLFSDEYDALLDQYGDRWYEFFFNKYHIINTIAEIKSNQKQLDILTLKYGQDWIERHIINASIQLQTITYEYAVKDKLSKKNVRLAKNIRSRTRDSYIINTIASDIGDVMNQNFIIKGLDVDDAAQVVDDLGHVVSRVASQDDVNTSTVNTSTVNTKISDMLGGNTDPIDDQDDPDYFFTTEATNIEITDDDIYDDDPDAIDISEIDNTINQTNKELKKIIGNAQFNSIKSIALEFDDTHDNTKYNIRLENIYAKHYITNQYIYQDDTILTIKNKICCSLLNNPKFGDPSYIIPQYQYMWLEYPTHHSPTNSITIDKLMLGHQWIMENELLKIDIEPHNNLEAYTTTNTNTASLIFAKLKSNLNRHDRIRYEDHHNDILDTYSNYCYLNELYMLDIYNEIGLDSQLDTLAINDLSDTYMRLYFPKITKSDTISIIDYLNSSSPSTLKQPEINKNKLIFESKQNSLLMDNQVMQIIEVLQVNDSIFNENYITQSILRTYVSENFKSINLTTVLNNFILSPKYPFAQLKAYDSIPTAKLYRDINTTVLSPTQEDLNRNMLKWITKSPYGLSFKIKISDPQFERQTKYLSVTLNNTGKVDCQMQWKETDRFTISEVNMAYDYVADLITKINQENSSDIHLANNENIINLDIPDSSDYAFAFVNSICKFSLVGIDDVNAGNTNTNNSNSSTVSKSGNVSFIINHQDLSDFARYFYPYVSLVIEPSKKSASVPAAESKQGTYLRFNRINNFDSKTRVENRILYFLKNYDTTDQQLALEIAKNFNTSNEAALQEITNVRKKYKYITKARKTLKRMDNIPKAKAPGIGLEILGKEANNYKIKITGARNTNQLHRILSFTKKLIQLYYETFLLKLPARQRMRSELQSITNIAQQKNKVKDIVEARPTTNTSVKKTIQNDKERLLKSRKGGWTRTCQNSGLDKRRQPKNYVDETELLELGYKPVYKLGEYNYKSYQKAFQVNGKSVLLHAFGLPKYDSTNPDDKVYYTCDPINNGEHMYLGFLNKSTGAPCCFKKNQFNTTSIDKKTIFLNNLGIFPVATKPIKAKASIQDNEQLYILQNTNKLQDGRLSFLSPNLDLFFNSNNKYKMVAGNHYLDETDGYYFNLGVNDMRDVKTVPLAIDSSPSTTQVASSQVASSLPSQFNTYINAIANTLNITTDQLIMRMLNLLKTDEASNNNAVYTSLNNGEIRSVFGNTNSEYMKYIETSQALDPKYINDILMQPTVCDTLGINIIIFTKRIDVTATANTKSSSFEKVTQKDNFYIECQNQENFKQLGNSNLKSIILVYDDPQVDLYYPIIKLVKSKSKKTTKAPDAKSYTITKLHPYDKSINQPIYEFYKFNCKAEFNAIVKSNIHLSVKELVYDHSIIPEIQVIDSYYKCKYVIIGPKQRLLLPTYLSGIVPSIKYTTSYDAYLKDFKKTYEAAIEVSKLYPSIDLGMIGLYFSDVTSSTANTSPSPTQPQSYTIVAIMTNKHGAIPIKPFKINSIKDITRDFTSITILDKIDIIDLIDDNQIIESKQPVIDERIISVMTHTYNKELFELFKYHLSYYLSSTTDGKVFKASVMQVKISSDPIDIKLMKLKQLFYQELSTDLLNKFNQLISQVKSANHENNMQSVFNITNANSNTALPIPISNKRYLCSSCTNQSSCSSHGHCIWSDTCKFNIQTATLIKFINKITADILQDTVSGKEVLNLDGYYVSSIVNSKVFDQRDNEKIITADNINIENVIKGLFGTELVNKAGKIAMTTKASKETDLNISNPIRMNLNWYTQSIIPNNSTIFRAFGNCFYWLKKSSLLDNVAARNLGYYSTTQTKLANIYKSQIVEWFLKQENDKYNDIIRQWSNGRTNMEIINDVYSGSVTTNCVVELFVLSMVNDVDIFVYDEYYSVVLAISSKDGLVYYKSDASGGASDTGFDVGAFGIRPDATIHIKFNYTSFNSLEIAVPNDISALYLK